MSTADLVASMLPGILETITALGQPCELVRVEPKHDPATDEVTETITRYDADVAIITDETRGDEQQRTATAYVAGGQAFAPLQGDQVHTESGLVWRIEASKPLPNEDHAAAFALELSR